MQKKLMIALLLLASASSFSLSAQRPAQVVIGRINSLYAEILKEQQTFWVHLPPGATAAALAFDSRFTKTNQYFPWYGPYTSAGYGYNRFAKGYYHRHVSPPFNP